VYVPSIHKSPEQFDPYEFIAQNGFATFITRGSSEVSASHIPLMTHKSADGTVTLEGHMARANPQLKDLNDKEALAIFMHPHAYISSSWYDHVNVPTWNYISVHVYGRCRVIEGAALIASLKRLVDGYEEGRSQRFDISDMSDDMLKAHMNGLVGFEMSLDRIETAHKLSQNRKNKDYSNIINQLNKEDGLSQATADEMKKLRNEE